MRTIREMIKDYRRGYRIIFPEPLNIPGLDYTLAGLYQMETIQ